MSAITFGTPPGWGTRRSPPRDEVASARTLQELAAAVSGATFGAGGSGSRGLSDEDATSQVLAHAARDQDAAKTRSILARFVELVPCGQARRSGVSRWGSAIVLGTAVLAALRQSGVEVGDVISLATRHGYPATQLVDAGQPAVALFPANTTAAVVTPEATYTLNAVETEGELTWEAPEAAAAPAALDWVAPQPKKGFWPAIKSKPVSYANVPSIIDTPLGPMADPAQLPAKDRDVRLKRCRGWHQIEMHHFGMAIQVVGPHTFADYPTAWGRYLEVVRRSSYAFKDSDKLNGSTVILSDGGLTIATLSRCGYKRFAPLNTDNVMDANVAGAFHESRVIRISVDSTGYHDHETEGGINSQVFWDHRDDVDPFRSTTMLHEMFHAVTLNEPKYATQMKEAFREGQELLEKVARVSAPVSDEDELTEEDEEDFTDIELDILSLGAIKRAGKYDVRVLTRGQVALINYKYTNADEWASSFAERYGRLFFRDIYSPIAVAEQWAQIRTRFPATAAFVETVFKAPGDLQLPPSSDLMSRQPKLYWTGHEESLARRAAENAEFEARAGLPKADWSWVSPNALPAQ